MERPEWIEFHMDRTDGLTSAADDLFRVVTGGNLGVSREFFEEAGGFDETFTQWGAEDTEFGYRAYTRGGLLVPEREGFCWHQGAGAAPSEEEVKSRELQRAKIAHLIAHYGFRGASSGRSFTVPQYAVSLEAGDTPVDEVFTAAERILRDRVHDLVLRIEDRPDDEGFEWLRRQLGPDPRVRFGPPADALDEFPVSAFHVRIPAGAKLVENLVHVLRNGLGEAVSGVMVLPDGGAGFDRAEPGRCTGPTARGRAIAYLGQRTTYEAAGHSFHTKAVLRSRWAARRARRVRSKAGRVLDEMRRIRSPRQAWGFLRWFTVAVLWRYKGRLRHRRTRTQIGGSVTGAVPSPKAGLSGGFITGAVPSPKAGLFGGPGASYPLGAEMAALGPRAARVFGASARVGRSLDGKHVDLVLADYAEEVDASAPAGVPVVFLSESPPRFAVPAFDPLVFNPVGWMREPQYGAGAIGSTEMLPPGAEVERRLSRGDREGLRLVHHLVDVASFHRDAAGRAGTLAALAGMGVVVHLADAGGGSGAGGLFGRRALRGDDFSRHPGRRLGEAGAVERPDAPGGSSGSFSSAAGPGGDRGRAWQTPPVLPEVSVLAVTKRPHLLPDLLAAVSSQTYPRLELILVLHGAGSGHDGGGAWDGAEEMVADLPFPVRMLRVDGSKSFGEALNLAVSSSGGALLTKIDDDDLYDAEHVWDLVLAREYSGGRAGGEGRRVRVPGPLGPDHSPVLRKGEASPKVVSVAGGTLLISRGDLEAAGGWRRVPRGVDVALIEDVRRVGGPGLPDPRLRVRLGAARIRPYLGDRRRLFRPAGGAGAPGMGSGVRRTGPGRDPALRVGPTRFGLTPIPWDPAPLRKAALPHRSKSPFGTDVLFTLPGCSKASCRPRFWRQLSRCPLFRLTGKTPTSSRAPDGGHAVGFSQWGAYGQAQEDPSKPGEDIAAHYYPGSEPASLSDLNLPNDLLSELDKTALDQPGRPDHPAGVHRRGGTPSSYACSTTARVPVPSPSVRRRGSGGSSAASSKGDAVSSRTVRCRERKAGAGLRSPGPRRRGYGFATDPTGARSAPCALRSASTGTAS